jgi:hypothetical protein
MQLALLAASSRAARTRRAFPARGATGRFRPAAPGAGENSSAADRSIAARVTAPARARASFAEHAARAGGSAPAGTGPLANHRRADRDRLALSAAVAPPGRLRQGFSAARTPALDIVRRTGTTKNLPAARWRGDLLCRALAPSALARSERAVSAEALPNPGRSIAVPLRDAARRLAEPSPAPGLLGAPTLGPARTQGFEATPSGLSRLRRAPGRKLTCLASGARRFAESPPAFGYGSTGGSAGRRLGGGAPAAAGSLAGRLPCPWLQYCRPPA